MAALNAESWCAVSPYLERALELCAEDRAAFVASLRSKDPSLATLLQMLLDEHSALEEERFLEQTSGTWPGLAGFGGQSIGPYTLISLLGQGGMGSVWLAERNDGRFERRAAVKFLSFVLLGRGEERFKREGKILGRLAHPHIAELLDAGVSQAGQPYLILEYVDGEHIDEYCDRRSLPVEVRIRLFLDVLDAVAHAHAHLIVHRDIKPSNVLVTAGGQVKLLDFGIAKLLEEDAAGTATPLTLEAGAALTPEYAAPEQLTGEAVTTVTDVYALGVLLYTLLSGQHPVNTITRSPAELVKAIVETEPLPLAQAAKAASMQAVLARATTPDKLQRALGGDLATITAKALKKNPQERYASTSAFAEDLRRYLNHQPVSARADTFAYRVTKFVRRNRTAVALAALAFLAAVLGLLGTITQARAARAQRDFALRQLARAETINELNSFVLSDAAPSGKSFTVDGLLTRAQHIVQQQSAKDVSHVELLISIGRQYTVQDEYAQARPLLEQAYRLSQTLQDPSTRARASCSLAQTLSRQGEFDRAGQLFQQGMNVLPREPIFAADRAGCLLRGSEVARNQGDVQTAIARALEAQRILRESPYSSDLLELDSQITLASVYSQAGRHREAVAAFERAAARLHALGRDDTQMASTVFNNWGVTLIRSGRPLDAEKVLHRCIVISRDREGDETVPAQSLVNYGRALFDLGRFREAANYAEKGEEKAQQAGDEAPIDQALMLRAAIYRNEGDLNRAAQMLSELEPRLQRHLPIGHIAFGSLNLQEALNAQSRGDLPEALRLADNAIAIAETQARNGGQGGDYLPLFLVRRSLIKLQAGLASEAEADSMRALELLQKIAAPGGLSSTLGRAYLAHSQALRALNKSDQALAEVRSAIVQLENTLGPDHPDTHKARQLANQWGISRR